MYQPNGVPYVPQYFKWIILIMLDFVSIFICVPNSLRLSRNLLPPVALCFLYNQHTYNIDNVQY